MMVCASMAYWHLFHAAVEISLMHMASVLVLDIHTGTFLLHSIAFTVALTPCCHCWHKCNFHT